MYWFVDTFYLIVITDWAEKACNAACYSSSPYVWSNCTPCCSALATKPKYHKSKVYSGMYKFHIVECKKFHSTRVAASISVNSRFNYISLY